MKALRQFFRLINPQTPLAWRSLKSTFRRLALRCSSQWQAALGVVKMKARSLSLKSVIQAIRTGLIVNLKSPACHLLSNKRHLIGIVLLVMGIASVFAHQFLFDMYEEPHDVCRLIRFPESLCFNRATGEGWCYMSWFYYYETIRFCIAAIFLTTAGYLAAPADKSVWVIIASTLQGMAWTGLFHYTFIVESHETYHSLQGWYFMAPGIALGFGIVLSAKYLAYVWNHRVKAFQARMGTLYNGLQVLTGDEFKAQYKKFYEERQAFQKQQY